MSSKARLLLLEDESALNETITEFLEEQGYDVVSVFDGDEAEEKLYETPFDLLLLDVNVPGVDGFSLLKSARKEGTKTPAIFLTSRSALADLEDGFESGADDYLRKPFALKELLLRIENLLKRTFHHDNSNRIALGENLYYDTAARILYKDGEMVTLGDKDDVLAGVLLDLSMTASINASVGVGDYILKKLGNVTRLHKSGVEQAAFVVLKSPDIPSILVEAGFISNPQEERNLLSSAHQNKVAQAVFEGIDEYFNNVPPPGTLLAWQKTNRGGTAVSEYRVQRGDTLSAVARRNQVSVEAIKRVNGLTNDVVMVGQTLQIPRS